MRYVNLLSRALIAVGLVFPAMAAPVAAQHPVQHDSPLDPATGRFGTSVPDASRPPDTLAVSSSQAWQALNAVYSQLGIALTIVDTSGHVVGAIRSVQRRPVAGERLSRLLECGTGQFGPNAERYTVSITAVSFVRALGDNKTTLETRVGGVASPNGLSTTVNCGSTGILEEKVLALLKTTLGI